MKSQSNSQELDKILDDMGEWYSAVTKSDRKELIREAKAKLLQLALSCKIPKMALDIDNLTPQEHRQYVDRQVYSQYDLDCAVDDAIDTIEQNILGRFS